MEKLGVIVEAQINKFKQNMSKVKEILGEAEKNFKTGLNIDVGQSEKDLKVLEDKIRKTTTRTKELLEEISKKQGKLDLFKQQQAIDGKLGGLRADQMRELEVELGKLNTQYKQSKDELIEYDKQYKAIDGDLDRTETKMGILGTVSKNIKETFTDAGRRIKECFNGEVKQNSEDIKENIEGIGKAGRGAGSSLSGMFGKGIKSLKRFALSLFGIQSIWRVLSRASSAYMQQNTELASKMQSIWNGLGTLIGPVIDVLADVFMKLIGYINVVTKALFNFDFVAKANENTMKNYQKQISKTNKALMGLDELQNINQNNNDEGPKGLIEIPELNSGIVKVLENMSKALKDNWDWISKVGIALGAVFGMATIGKWIGNIGKLLGVAGAGGAGGAGLLGLASTLAWIGGLGVLAVEIAIAYKYGKDLWDADQGYIEGSNELSNMSEKTTDAIIKLGQQGYKKGTREQNAYISHLKTEISENAQLIKDNQDKLTSYNLIDGGIAQLTGKYQQQTKAIEEAENRIDKLIEAFGEEYKQGKLTQDQEEYYIELLNTRNETIKRSGQVYSVVTKNYEGLTEQNINNNKKLENSWTNVANTIKNVGTTAKQSADQAKTEVDSMVTTIANKLKNPFKILFNKEEVKQEIPNKVQEMINIITNQLRNPFTILFKSKVEKPDLSEVQNIINGVFGKLGVKAENGWVSAFGVRLFKIPGFAVGTDLVKSDGLAYIHAGEQIVPAKAVGGGYSGNNNDTNELLRQLIEVVQDKEFSANISSDDVGKASVNYIRTQNRIRGGSII